MQNTIKEQAALPAKIEMQGVNYVLTEHEGAIIFSPRPNSCGDGSGLVFFRGSNDAWRVSIRSGAADPELIIEAYAWLVEARGDHTGNPFADSYRAHFADRVRQAAPNFVTDDCHARYTVELDRGDVWAILLQACPARTHADAVAVRNRVVNELAKEIPDEEAPSFLRRLASLFAKPNPFRRRHR